MKKVLLLALLCGLARADVTSSVAYIAGNVWTPDRVYLQKCVRDVGMPVEATLLILAQEDYFTGLADRFHVVESTVKILRTEVAKQAWEKLRVTKLEDLIHYSPLNFQTVWLGPLDYVSCHFSAASPYLPVSLQDSIKVFVARVERIKQLYAQFLKASEEEKWIQFEIFSQATLEAWDRAEELINATEKNLFVGHRSRSQRRLMEFHRQLF